MADDAEDEGSGGKAAKGKSKKKLIIIGGAAAAVVVLGAGGFFFMKKGGGEHGEKAEAHAEASAGEHGAEGAKAEKTAYVDLPEMTVNLATVDQERQRYVRLNIALEVDKAEMAEAIKPMMPRVLDSFTTHLRELRPEDIRGSSGAYRLKEELLRRVNTAVAPAKVDAVLFKDMVIQ